MRGGWRERIILLVWKSGKVLILCACLDSSSLFNNNIKQESTLNRENTFFKFSLPSKSLDFLTAYCSLFLPWSDGWWLITKCFFLFLFFRVKKHYLTAVAGGVILYVYFSRVFHLFSICNRARVNFFILISLPFHRNKTLSELRAHQNLLLTQGIITLTFIFLARWWLLYFSFLYIFCNPTQQMENAQCTDKPNFYDVYDEVGTIFLLFFISLVFKSFLFVFLCVVSSRSFEIIEFLIN